MLEYRKPPDEYSVPPEYGCAGEYINDPEREYTPGPASAQVISKRHKWIKWLMFGPVAAIVATLSLLLSSLGLDPLGSDFLTTGSLSSTTASGFPVLSNLAPDFAGAYAWSGSGSEEYVRFRTGASQPYDFIEMGGVWANMGETDANGNFVPYKLVSPSNAVYDKATNTLTLTNFTAYDLDVNLMGNGFTIKLVGENKLDRLCIWGAYYGGSVTLTGDGSLTVNKDGNSSDGVGIRLQGEFSQSCLMIDKDVTLDVYGAPAILIGATTMEQSLYYLPPLEMTGGEYKNGDFVQYSAPIVDDDGNYLGIENLTISEISERDGNRYYDASVVGEDGNLSTHVRFAPASE